MIPAEPQRIRFDIKFALSRLTSGQTAGMTRKSRESRTRARGRAAEQIYDGMRLWEIFKDVAGVMTPVDRDEVLAVIELELATTSHETWQAFRSGTLRDDTVRAMAGRIHDRFAHWMILVNEPARPH